MNIKEKTASLRAGELAVIYIGQAGFIISDGTVSVAVDPYLSYSVDLAIETGDGKWTRLYAPPVMPDELSFLDFVFISHDHLDHADPETI
ncbi:MAG: MBL fold metallo-hydrolase, partial [Lachnospiraceae bacterium]